jgi:glycosyltransferase involved in cell wall biosynthesis
LFYKCDIFCLPSYGDFLPMVLAEAGAAGLPSVTTKIAAIPEIIQDGISGILVSPGDREGLENALQNLIFNRQLRIEMGENARKFVSKAFAAETNAQKLLDLLKCEIIKAA